MLLVGIVLLYGGRAYRTADAAHIRVFFFFRAVRSRSARRRASHVVYIDHGSAPSPSLTASCGADPEMGGTLLYCEHVRVSAAVDGGRWQIRADVCVGQMADAYGLKESLLEVCPGIGRDGAPMANRSFASFACERQALAKVRTESY